MQKLTIYLLIGAVVVVVPALAFPQEVHMYGGRGQVAAIGGGDEGHDNNDEVQDEAELSSALGIDRRAIYEDLMRIQEELGGSPFPGPLGGPHGGEHSPDSQENEQEYPDN